MQKKMSTHQINLLIDYCSNALQLPNLNSKIHE